MSLNELAVDLTCDPAPFRVARTPLPDEEEHEEDEEEYTMPGSLPFPPMEPPPPVHPPLQSWPSTASMASEADGVYIVHGGMLRMARVMGEKGKPVHRAVRHALKRNKGYG